LLLNQNQVDIILDKSPWKLISGHFGSGKSICLKEIAKRLYQKNDGSTVFFICFDPYSLLETEITKYFETISNDGRLQSLSISEISSQAGFSVEQFCNQLGPPEKNIADLFEYLQEAYGKCHLLVDEFHTDNITEQYCERLKQSLGNKFQDSTLVIATQSITTTKHLVENGKKEHKFETCSLENTGMKPMSLVKAMRSPSNIFDLTKIAMDLITKTETELSLPSAESENKIENESFSPSNKKESADFHKTISDGDTVTKFVAKFDTFEKKEKKYIDVIKLADPQILAKMNSETNKTQTSALLKLKSKSEFVDGECGTICNDTKPKVIFLHDEFSISNGQSCRILTEILNKQILQTSQNISFICNDLNEIACITYALEICEHPFFTYAPFLLGQLPSSREKMLVIEKLYKKTGNQLITDYRSCRGCEFEHCVFFINPNEQFVNHTLVEMMTRSISKLDIFVYPCTKTEEIKTRSFIERILSYISVNPSTKIETTSCLANILACWDDDEDNPIEKITIKASPKNHKCTIDMGDNAKEQIRFTQSELNTFQEIQQSVQQQGQYNKDDTLQ